MQLTPDGLLALDALEHGVRVAEQRFARVVGSPFVATIEPWHGSELVVWQLDVRNMLKGMVKGLFTGNHSSEIMSRTVIDNTLDDGHALWVADVDGDGDDEVFAGHRGKAPRVSIYDFDGKSWNRTVIDTAITAQDLRGGDLDGDGVPDVVAIGGKSHNVVWYRPIRSGPDRP